MDVALLERIFAAAVLVACVVLGLRLAIGPERIARALRWRAVRRTAARDLLRNLNRMSRKMNRVAPPKVWLSPPHTAGVRTLRWVPRGTV